MLYPEPSFQCDEMLVRGELGRDGREEGKALESRAPQMETRNQRQGQVSACFKYLTVPFRDKGPQWMANEWVTHVMQWGNPPAKGRVS